MKIYDLSGQRLGETWSGVDFVNALYGLTDHVFDAVDLSDNALAELEGNGHEIVFGGLGDTRIRTLILRDNALENMENRSLFDMLYSLTGTDVTHLDLAKNELGTYLGAKQLAAVLGGLKETNVRTLDLSKTGTERWTNTQRLTVLNAVNGNLRTVIMDGKMIDVRASCDAQSIVSPGSLDSVIMRRAKSTPAFDTQYPVGLSRPRANTTSSVDKVPATTFPSV